MPSRLRFGVSCTVLLSAWVRLAAAQTDAPAAADAVPTAPAASPAPAAPAPASPEQPAAPAESSASPPSDAVPAWPQSESECKDWAKSPPAAVLPKLEAEVAHRYLARLIPVLGFAAGGGLGSDAGFGWRVGSRVDLGILSPLWLSGSAYYAHTGGKSSGQIDFLTGFNLVSWGTRWVNAGHAEAGGAISVWSSHCQHRRNEFG